MEWPPFEGPNQNPLEQPPAGIEHHFSRLAIVERVQEQLKVTADCRKIFQPLTEIAAAPAPAVTPPPEAMYLKGTSWKNDAPLVLEDFLNAGLTVVLDGRPLVKTVSRTTMTVELELPITPGVVFGTSADVPRMRVMIPGVISSSNGEDFRWLPAARIMDSIGAFLAVTRQVTGRVTLKGAVIWSGEGERRIYLDGRALGIAERVPDTENLRTALVFPSGSGERSSDFESWFLLTLPGEPGLRSFKIEPSKVRMVRREREFFFSGTDDRSDSPARVRGIVTLSEPAVSNLDIVLTTRERGELVILPDKVTILAGQISADFPIAFGRNPQDQDVGMHIFATLGAAQQEAVLAIVGLQQ